jgi:hypothetical protein
VRVAGGLRQPVVEERQARALAVGLERHLHERGTDPGEEVAALEAPCEDDTVRRIDLEVLAKNDVAAVGLDANVPPGRGSSSAETPIQSTIRAGSVKYGNTTSGGAAIRTSLRTGSVAPGIAPPGCVLLLGGHFQATEGSGPHPLDVRPYLLEALRAGLIETPHGL